MGGKTFMDANGTLSRRRRAAKQHRCGSCDRRVPVGDVYLEHVAFPGHDALGYGTAAPSRMRECAPCAKRYGREYYLDEVPYEQLCRDGLL